VPYTTDVHGTGGQGRWEGGGVSHGDLQTSELIARIAIDRWQGDRMWQTDG
jgi:hypothetical protein